MILTLSCSLTLRILIPAHLCDDALITAAAAANLAGGDGLALNPGERVYVTTSPLWALLLSAATLLHADIVMAAKILGAAFESLALVTMVFLGRAVTGSIAVGVMAALLTAANPAFLLTSFSGMEVPLNVFLTLLSFLLLARGRSGASLLVAACAVWTRIDGLLIWSVVLVWVLVPRAAKPGRRLALVGRIVPFVLVIAGYALFGLLYYGRAVPSSLTAKLQTGPPLLSGEWAIGAVRVLVEFASAVAGASSTSYSSRTPLWALVIPFVIGLGSPLLRLPRLRPVLSFTVLHAAAFAASGNVYVLYFPWYFVPVIPGLMLVVSLGLHRVGCWSITSVRGRFARAVRPGLALAFGSLVIASVAGPVARAARVIESRGRERERGYAVAAVWLGQRLDPGATIAAGEIGALALFARPDVSILDTFGLARVSEDRHLTSVDFVRKRAPDAVVTRRHFSLKTEIDRGLQGSFQWIKFRTLWIGLRFAPAALPADSVGLVELYATLDVEREPRWPRQRPASGAVSGAH